MNSTSHREAFIQTIKENGNLLHKITHLYARTREEREDLEQEIIYQLWKSWDSWRREAKLQTWMYRVALNTALHQRKRRPPDNMELSQKLIAETGMDHASKHTEELEQLYAAIQRLHELDRALILLWLEAHSYAEIALVTGISEKNVSVRIHRVKGKLKEYMNL